MGRLRAGCEAQTLPSGHTRALGMVVVVLLLTLLSLAACSGGEGGSSLATPSVGAQATVAAGQGTGTGQSLSTPTSFAVTTPGAQQGTAEFCAASANVSAQLPASIPAYPSAQLRLGQSAGGSGIFGLCSGGSVAVVVQFYAAQLPANGWQQVTTTTNAGVQQVQATKGSAHVVITVEPDAQISGTTEIIIITTGM